MANGKIRFGKQSGGELALVIPDGVSNTEVIVPESGVLATKDYADTKQSKSELAYDEDTSKFIPNTLSSKAIIERGSNANGEYIKFVDGTLICIRSFITADQAITSPYGSLYVGTISWTYPYTFVDEPFCSSSIHYTDQASWSGGAIISTTNTTFYIVDIVSRPSGSYVHFKFLAIGKWK